MNATPLVAVSTILASVIAIAAVKLTTSPGGDPAPVSTESTDELADHTRELEARIERLERELTAVRNQPQTARADVPSVEPAWIEAAVERYFAANGGTDAVVDAAARVADADAAAFDAKATFEDLRTTARSWEGIQAIWSKMSTEQKDAVIAQFEMVAEANPNDPSAQNELGEAYVHRLMNEDMLGMMKYGQLAEKQFDRALELDDHHWSARFNKAMSLSNQPAFLGRRPEAIKHFQTLMEQQEVATPETKHAQTYLFLGNLHAQSGNPDKAKEIWQRGLSRFPSAEVLLDKVGR